LYRAILILIFLCMSDIAHGQADAPIISVVADQQVESRFADGEELIMTVRIDNYVFGEVFAIKTTESVHVELEGLLIALDFPIYYEQDLKRFSGWFIDEENTFTLGYSETPNTPIIYDPEGAAQALSNNDFTIVDGILYVSLERINGWFGLAGRADFQDLMLYFDSRSKLPFQQRIERQRRQVRSGNASDIKYSRLRRGFGLLSPQAIDLQLNALYSNDRNEVNSSYSLLGSRDVALFNTQFFLSGSNRDWLNIARLQVSKSDENNRLFGINNLANIKIGDITPVRQSNGATLRQSRGVLIDNLTRNNDINLDATSVAGEIQSGWDVELYLNGVLRGQQFEVETGRFEFNDIPLDAGINKLRIVMYGPQGQVVERTEERILDRAAVSSNKVKYQLSINQNGKSLFGLEEQTILGDEDQGFNVSGNIQKTIFGNTALNAGLSSQLGGDNPTNVATIATNTAVANRFILGTNLQADDKENYQVSANARGSFWEQNVSLGVTYNSSQNEITQIRNDQLLSRLDISGQIPLAAGLSLSYRNDFAITTQDSGDRFEFRNSIGFTSKFIDIFNNIAYINPVSGDEQRIGGISVQRAFGPVFTRVNAAYTFQDGFDFNDVRLDVSWLPFDNISSRFTYNRNILNKTNDFQLQTSWNTDSFSLTGVVKQSDVLGASVGINAQVSLGGAPVQYNSVFRSVNTVATKSSLLVRVFIDENVNGYYDMGEQLIPDVKVMSIQSRMNALTNENGIAALTNLPDGRVTDITLDYSTLEDPFLVPLVEGVAIKSRAGHIDNLDFPLAIGNEIEGLVQAVNELDVKIPISRATVELLDKNGVVRHKTTTEFDGYYLFNGVVSGTYSLRLNPDYLERTRFKAAPMQTIRITNETGLLSGLDLYIEEKEFAQGFAPIIGGFTNKRVANLFWKKAKSQSFLNVFKETAFVLERDQKTQIALGLFEDLDIAQKVCASIRSKYEECEVVAHSVEINHIPSVHIADNRQK
jgi:hypothetical protein